MSSPYLLSSELAGIVADEEHPSWTRKVLVTHETARLDRFNLFKDYEKMDSWTNADKGLLSVWTVWQNDPSAPCLHVRLEEMIKRPCG